MTNETEPYISRNPGDLWTAEDWNKVQVEIKEDMQDQIKSAKEQVKKSGVERADNADQFDKKTPKEWTDDLDERYAPKVHDHEETAAYRRYYKQIEPDDRFVLQHLLGRFPLVDVYELHPILPDPDQGDPIMEKFYLYYHHEERDRDFLFTLDRGRVRWAWGTPLEQLLGEYQVKWEDDDSLGDVINDFIDVFFSPPADHISHRTSPWIDDKRDRTIGELKQRDEWPDIRWTLRPQKLIVGGYDSETPIEQLVQVAHLSCDALEIFTTTQMPRREVIDLMILLRS